MERKDYILDDSALRDLADTTPYSEGGLLSDFMDEAEEVVEAITKTGVKIKDERARLLFLMRGFYLLGILRGGEEYRGTLQAVEEVESPGMEQTEFERVPFELSDSCADLFADDLNGLTPKEITQLWASLGL